MCFYVKYKKVTDTLSCVVTEKNLYLNLLLANQIFLWIEISVSLGP